MESFSQRWAPHNNHIFQQLATISRILLPLFAAILFAKQTQPLSHYLANNLEKYCAYSLSSTRGLVYFASGDKESQLLNSNHFIHAYFLPMPLISAPGDRLEKTIVCRGIHVPDPIFAPEFLCSSRACTSHAIPKCIIRKIYSSKPQNTMLSNQTLVIFVPGRPCSSDCGPTGQLSSLHRTHLMCPARSWLWSTNCSNLVR